MTIHLDDMLSLFEGAPSGLILLSGDYQAEYYNPAAAPFVGGSAPQAPPLHLTEPQTPYQIPALRKPRSTSRQTPVPPALSWLAPELEDFSRSDAPAASFEKTVEVDGDYRHLSVTLRRRQDHNGSGNGTAVFFWDITPQRHTEEALTIFEAKCHACLNNPFEGILFMDISGRILEANEQMREMLGVASKEALPPDLGQFFPPELSPEYLADFRKVIQEGAVTLTTHWLQRRDGTTLPVDLELNLMRFAGETLVRAIFRDITQREKREMEQLRLCKLESLGRLAAGIAHDFNNILTAILGNITLAGLDADLKPFSRERLEEAEKACLRAHDLTQELLAFAKGGRPLKKRLSLDVLLREIRDDLQPRCTSQVEFWVSPDLWPVEADPTQIKQAITNLIINADQATDFGGRIRLEGANITQAGGEDAIVPPGDYVRIAVADQGPGIPAQHLAQIFDPYFTTKDMRQGLGLAMVHAIVKHHGGFISVTTQARAGTCFQVYLPALQHIPQAPEKADDRAMGGQSRILLMDDEAIIRDIVSRMLHKLGYEVDTAAHGAEALGMYDKARKEGRAYAAVIFDLTVAGGMGGKETMAKLRQTDPAARAIVSSGYCDDPVMAEYQKYGFRSALAKPYKIVELSRALTEALANDTST